MCPQDRPRVLQGKREAADAEKENALGMRRRERLPGTGDEEV